MGRDEGKLKDHILALLADVGSPLDDDAIATRIGVARQQINDRCRRLARSGLIERGRGEDGKIVNRGARPSAARGQPAASSAPSLASQPAAVHANEPPDWFWEGHIQTRLRDHFVAKGWRVLRESDCLSRERGIDLLLEDGRAQLAVEVKGFPSTTYSRGPMKGQAKPTQPTLQAKHWFADALLAAIRTQSKHPAYTVAIAFPDMPRYRRLIESTRHALTRIRLGVFLVQDSGAVVEVLTPAAASEPL